jgi:hypothetical protein
MNLKSKVEEGFHRIRNVRWRTVSPLRDGNPSGLRARKRCPPGPFDFAQGRRIDRFGAVDDMGPSSFGEANVSEEELDLHRIII